jgi:hypothetical protein
MMRQLRPNSPPKERISATRTSGIIQILDEFSGLGEDAQGGEGVLPV